jgi:glycosyltransferase involved in cell wall biosynthesis
VRPGESGEVVADPTDAAEIAERIRALAPPAARVRAGAAAAREAARHTWDAHLARVLAVYEEVAASKRARTAAALESPPRLSYSSPSR